MIHHKNKPNSLEKAVKKEVLKRNHLAFALFVLERDGRLSCMAGIHPKLLPDMVEGIEELLQAVKANPQNQRPASIRPTPPTYVQ